MPFPRSPIPAAATSVAAFVGRAETGPTDAAVPVDSLRAFEIAFGDPATILGDTVRHFFENGGTRAEVIRRDTDLAAAFAAGGPLDNTAFQLLCVPETTDATVLTAAHDCCLRNRAFLIADWVPEHGPGPPFAATNAAFYYPPVLRADGSGPAPACGFVAGAFARTDANFGVWTAPVGARTALRGAAGLSLDLPARDADDLLTRGVNTLRTFFLDRMSLVWGARTATGPASEWRYVSVRRAALFIESSLREGLAWTAFEPNDEPLWAEVRRSAAEFLTGLWRTGALRGDRPEEAYFVKCGRDTTSDAEIASGELVAAVGLALLREREFTVVRLQLSAAAGVA